MVEQLPRSREEALWAAEVAGLFGAADSLPPAPRAAVVTVLRSLAADPDASPAERADVSELFDTLAGVPPAGARRPEGTLSAHRIRRGARCVGSGRR
jgi:hypothetical protein